MGSLAHLFFRLFDAVLSLSRARESQCRRGQVQQRLGARYRAGGGKWWSRDSAVARLWPVRLINTRKVIAGRFYGGAGHCYCRYLGDGAGRTQQARPAFDHLGEARFTWNVRWYYTPGDGGLGAGGSFAGHRGLGIAAMSPLARITAICRAAERAGGMLCRHSAAGSRAGHTLLPGM